MSDEKQLGQAKKRDKKVYITVTAIEKVPYIEYKGMSREQNIIMRQFARMVLRLSKDNYDSNEVAVTWNLETGDSSDFGIAHGDEEHVNLASDTATFHLLRSGDRVVLVVLHNHPSTRTFSVEDIFLFIRQENMKYIVTVSNQGQIHYIKKEENYNAQKAVMLYNTIRQEISSKENSYQIALAFLRRCSEAGLYYR